MIDKVFIFLPIVTFLALFLLLLKQGNCWRQSILTATIIWALFLTVVTEILSIFSLINFVCLVAVWSLSSSLLILRLLKTASTPKFNKILLELRQAITSVSPFVVLSIAGISFIALAIGFIAIASPPNNWDSMTYHMSRVVNWIQNQNVAHYPTPILRQLDLSPWSGFAILHFQILSGGDRFANLVQWFSMLGSIVTVSLIAKQLGAKLTGQILASLVCISIPMGILQSSTTQNDYVVSFLLACFVFNVLLAVNHKLTPKTSFEIGASLGLAILTKATAYVYALPFCIVLIAIILVRNRWKIWQGFVIALIPLLVVNYGHWKRNFDLFQDPLGSSGDSTLNQLFSISAFVSNVLRNIGLHVATFNQEFNDAIENLIIWLHKIIGLSINDPRTTFLSSNFQIPITPKYQPIFFHEDFSGNPLHLLLIVFCICLYIGQSRIRTQLLTIYLATLLGSFGCFNLLLAWQPWGTRLHLPLFVLFSAFIGTIFSRGLPKSLSYILVVTLIFTSIPYVFFSAARPLVLNQEFMIFAPGSITELDRVKQYFSNSPGLEKPYRRSINFVGSRGCTSIGTFIRDSYWEYPFWAIAKGKAINGAPFRFKSVEVSNVSASIDLSQQPRRDFVPCAIISVADDNTLDKNNSINTSSRKPVIRIEGTYYVKSWEQAPVTVYLENDK